MSGTSPSRAGFSGATVSAAGRILATQDEFGATVAAGGAGRHAEARGRGLDVNGLVVVGAAEAAAPPTPAPVADEVRLVDVPNVASVSVGRGEAAPAWSNDTCVAGKSSGLRIRSGARRGPARGRHRRGPLRRHHRVAAGRATRSRWWPKSARARPPSASCPARPSRRPSKCWARRCCGRGPTGNPVAPPWSTPPSGRTPIRRSSESPGEGGRPVHQPAGVRRRCGAGANPGDGAAHR